MSGFCSCSLMFHIQSCTHYIYPGRTHVRCTKARKMSVQSTFKPGRRARCCQEYALSRCHKSRKHALPLAKNLKKTPFYSLSVGLPVLVATVPVVLAMAIILSDLRRRDPNTGPPTPPATEGLLPHPHCGGTSLTPPIQLCPSIGLVRLTTRGITPADHRVVIMAGRATQVRCGNTRPPTATANDGG